LDRGLDELAVFHTQLTVLNKTAPSRSHHRRCWIWPLQVPASPVPSCPVWWNKRKINKLHCPSITSVQLKVWLQIVALASPGTLLYSWLRSRMPMMNQTIHASWRAGSVIHRPHSIQSSALSNYWLLLTHVAYLTRLTNTVPSAANYQPIC